MAKKLSFSLIYLKPTSSTIEGFETCRAIHKIEKFKDVPIILLATLNGRVDPRYTTYYGIVDYLKMPLNTDELIERTRKIFSSSSEDLQQPKESVAVVEQGDVVVEEPAGFQEEYDFDTEVQKISGTEQTAEDIVIDQEEDVITDEATEIQEEPAAVYEVDDIPEEPAAPDEAEDVRQAEEDFSYSIEQEKQQEKQKESRSYMNTKEKPKSSIISILLFAGIAVIAIVAGFFAYRMYFSSPAIEKPAAVEAPSVQPQETVPSPSEDSQKPEQVVEEPAPDKVVAEPVSAETVKEVPVTVQKIEPKGKPVHSVQLGAFKTESTAEALANTYKGRGYEAFVQKGATKGNEVIYRVLIGKFENRKEAFQFANEIRVKEKTGTTVFSE